jgi:hypothetical protein
MGGLAGTFSIIGGVESSTDAFSVMGGTNEAPKSINTSQYGALNAFR